MEVNTIIEMGTCLCARGRGLEENLFSKFNIWTFLSLRSLPLVNRMTAQQKRRKSQAESFSPARNRLCWKWWFTLGLVIMIMLTMLQLLMRLLMIIKEIINQHIINQHNHHCIIIIWRQRRRLWWQRPRLGSSGVGEGGSGFS